MTRLDGSVSFVVLLCFLLQSSVVSAARGGEGTSLHHDFHLLRTNVGSAHGLGWGGSHPPTLLLDDSAVHQSSVSSSRSWQRSWPEVVGLSVKEAKDVILKDAPGVHIVVVPKGWFVTMDVRLNRVRIFVDDNRIVVMTPRVG